MALSAIQDVRAGHRREFGLAPKSHPFWRLVDWNSILRRLNAFYDALGYAAAARNYDHFYKRLAPTQRSVRACFRAFWRSSFHLPTATVYEQFLATIAPSLRNAGFLAFAASTSARFSRIVMALDVYKADQGAFPRKLSALCPKYLRHVGLDAFNGKPPIYNRTSTGYMLRSAGPLGHLMRRPKLSIRAHLLILLPPLDKAAVKRLAAGKTVDGLRAAGGRHYFGESAAANNRVKKRP